MAYYSDYYIKPSWVYRLYDAAGSLLYVGLTTNPVDRVPSHRRKSWGPLIDHYTIERFPDRESAKVAERSAIHREEPIHNLVRPQGCC